MSKGKGSKGKSSGGAAKSAITGRFVTKATAARHPKTTYIIGKK